jgi:RHS repeat-associated protein
MLVATPAAAEPDGWRETAPKDVEGVRVVDAKVPPGKPAWTAEASAQRGPAKVTWPAASSATVDLAGGPGRAAGQPIRLGRTDLGRPPMAAAGPATGVGKVRVDIADRAATARAGVSGLMFAMRSTDGSSGPVAVEVDYAGFAEAFGGDYASRTRLVRLPACALTSPERAECQGSTPVSTSNNVKGRTLTASVSVAATGMTVLATEAGPSGDNGDYQATSLAPAGSWQVSTQSGAFSWNYPLRMPPSLGGPTPSIGLAYSSASIDGRTSTTNNQGSWLGDGWEMWPGYIERTYNSCKNDGAPGRETGDLCWLSDNATLSLGGHSGELIRSGNVYRLKADDGTRVERVTGDAARANGAADNEYWKITTTDGTQYYFGYHRLPNWQSGNPVTESTWTAQVYGDDAGEPCPQAYCTQAWRWNLDYIVDPHGNTEALFYQKETGAYAQNNTASQRVTYERGGWLDRIEYGMRAGSEYAQAAPLRVRFDTAERCLSGCWTGTAWQSDPVRAAWLDTPWDQYCTTAPCDAFSPTFWTARRLTKITTQVRNGTTSYADVESWSLRQEFLDAGTSEGTPMWLRGITRTGHVVPVGVTPPSDPEIVFDPGTVPLPNRVDGPAANRTSLNRWRITSVTNESGGQTRVTYSPVSDCSRSAPPNPEFNTSRCMPTLVDMAGTPTLDWFHKYVVTRVDSDDIVTDQPTETNFYDYPTGGGAWAYATDEVTKDNLRTWSQWRGYGQVTVRHGDPVGRQTATEYRYLRGMDGDTSPSSTGGRRDVQVTDPWGGTIEDHEALQGFSLAEITYDGPGGAEVTSTVNRPWMNGPTASRTRGGVTVEAWKTATGQTRTRTALASGGHRYVKTVTTFNTDGFPIAVDDVGDEGVTGDDTCERTTYARNDTSWMIDKVAQVELLTGKCSDAATPAAPATVLSRSRSFYDTYVNESSFGAAPTEGDPVRTEQLDTWTANTPVYQAVTRSTFDHNGRPIQVIDARGNATTTGYTTANGGLVTQTSVTNAKTHTTVSLVEPAWGLPTRVTGPNNTTDGINDVTELTYDGLGRLTQVWMPGRARNLPPSQRMTYTMRNGPNLPTAATTEALLPNGAYAKSVTVYDGWLRERQVQTLATGGGRLLADTVRDAAGDVLWTSAPYHDKSDAPVSTELGQPTQTIPSVTRHVLDGAGRERATVLVAAGLEHSRTTIDYGGDRIHQTPPAGGTATTSILDAKGNAVELRQYKDRAFVGSTDPVKYLATKYTYKPTGQLSTVEDPAHNQWSYDYDLRGRQTSFKDPDKGLSTVTYDAAGNVQSTKDSKNQVLWFGYDELNRQTWMRDDSPTGALRASWVYDTLQYGKGRLTSSTRWVGSVAYTSRVDTYDPAGRQTSASLVLPASEGALCAAGGSTPCVYTTKTGYRVNGAVYQITTPATANLPAEKLTFGYTDVGAPNTLISDIGSYVFSTTYNKTGQLIQRKLGVEASKVVLNAGYNEGTGRLERQWVEATGKPDPADLSYTYDAAGNVDKIADAPGGQLADTQCFRRDYLRRLTNAWTPASGNCTTNPTVAGLQAGAAAYWHQYTHDDIGNRRTHTVNTAAGPTTYTYTVPASGATSVRPHAVTSVLMAGPGGSTWTRDYTYDPAGNTENRPSEAGVAQILRWDREQRLTSVTENGGNPTTFLYDAAGNRLIRTDGNGAKTLYLPSGEVRVAAGAPTATATRYYSFASATIGMRTGAGVTWLVSDHHGTAELAIKAGDLSVSQRRTTPFGKERGGEPSTWPTGTDTGFVGGVKDTTGLTHLGAREYDPLLGRFVSVDPLLDVNDPQSMNNYAYSGNDPIDYTDPAGTRRCPPDKEDSCTEHSSANATTTTTKKSWNGTPDRGADNSGLNGSLAAPPGNPCAGPQIAADECIDWMEDHYTPPTGQPLPTPTLTSDGPPATPTGTIQQRIAYRASLFAVLGPAAFELDFKSWGTCGSMGASAWNGAGVSECWGIDELGHAHLSVLSWSEGPSIGVSAGGGLFFSTGNLAAQSEWFNFEELTVGGITIQHAWSPVDPTLHTYMVSGNILPAELSIGLLDKVKGSPNGAFGRSYTTVNYRYTSEAPRWVDPK